MINDWQIVKSGQNFPSQQYTHHYGEVDQQSAYKNTWCIKITTNIRLALLETEYFLYLQL